MTFTKMHALGNDFVVMNAMSAPIDNPERLSRFICDRKYGAGSDGLVVIARSDKADIRMIMYNPDGTPAMCGNALRCVGKYAYTRGLVNETSFTVETVKGVNRIELTLCDGVVCKVSADIGEPSFAPDVIPCVRYITDMPVTVSGRTFRITAANVGNPHCVTFVDDIDTIDVASYGSVLEKSELFPKKTNVEFVSIKDRNNVRMRVWERGAGLTLACGTGCCATAVTGIRLGYLDSKVRVLMPGGALDIEWNGPGSGIKMVSDAEFIYDGTLDKQAFERFERIYENAAERFHTGN